MRRLLVTATLAAALPALAAADEVTDTIQSAVEAYEAGEIQFAIDDLQYATQLLQEMKADSLTGFLPPAPDGWTRELDTEANAGLAMMGGGSVVTGRYSGPDGNFELTIMLDNPMVAGMAGMFSNLTMLRQMGQVSRIGRQPVLNQNGELTTLVDGRVLIQASGADPEVMMPFLEAMDFEGLADFAS